MKIGNSEIGPGQPVYVVADGGLCWDGIFSKAVALTEAAAKAGCQAIKWQRRTVDVLAIPSVLDAPVDDPRFPDYPGTYRELRQAHEFSLDELHELKTYANELGLAMFVTPFDEQALDEVMQLDPPCIKVASHSVTNLPLLRRIAQTGKPVLMSTGMATYAEVLSAWSYFKNNVVLMHCVSAYPTPPESANLLMLEKYRHLGMGPIGYSGHEEGTLPTLLAVALGACVVERHITLDNRAPGFDHALALTPPTFRALVDDIRLVEALLGDGVKRITPPEQVTRDKYRVSIASRRAISAGQIITDDDLYLTNPGTGMPASLWAYVVGRVAAAAIPAGILIREEQLR